MAHKSAAALAAQLRRLDHYELLDTIGEGRHGKVKLGRHILTGTQVAIKIIQRQGVHTDPRGGLREVRCMLGLRHPNIVQLFEVIDTDKSAFLIMEHASRGNLGRYLEIHGRMEESAARRTFRQLVSAVHYCHGKGIIHRDVKPQNVLLDRNLDARLADFSLSTPFNGSKLSTFCGTPLYTAPELFQGEEYDGPPVDIWSLGVVLYHMVTGTTPFKGKDLMQLVKQIKSGIYAVPQYLTVELQHLLGKLITRNPADRSSLTDILPDLWLNSGYLEELRPFAEPDSYDLDPHVERQMLHMGFEREDIQNALAQNTYDNNIMATYLMLTAEKSRDPNRPTVLRPFKLIKPKGFDRSADTEAETQARPKDVEPGQGTEDAAGPSGSPRSRKATPGPSPKSMKAGLQPSAKGKKKVTPRHRPQLKTAFPRPSPKLRRATARASPKYKCATPRTSLKSRTAALPPDSDSDSDLDSRPTTPPPTAESGVSPTPPPPTAEDSRPTRAPPTAGSGPRPTRPPPTVESGPRPTSPPPTAEDSEDSRPTRAPPTAESGPKPTRPPPTVESGVSPTPPPPTAEDSRPTRAPPTAEDSRPTRAPPTAESGPRPTRPPPTVESGVSPTPPPPAAEDSRPTRAPPTAESGPRPTRPPPTAESGVSPTPPPPMQDSDSRPTRPPPTAEDSRPTSAPPTAESGPRPTRPPPTAESGDSDSRPTPPPPTAEDSRPTSAPPAVESGPWPTRAPPTAESGPRPTRPPPTVESGVSPTPPPPVPDSDSRPTPPPPMAESGVSPTPPPPMQDSDSRLTPPPPTAEEMRTTTPTLKRDPKYATPRPAPQYGPGDSSSTHNTSSTRSSSSSCGSAEGKSRGRRGLARRASRMSPPEVTVVHEATVPRESLDSWVTVSIQTPDK
ncbi:serine/threonine-protein kinase MARK2-like, partial [Rhinolophus ferrumequinum]|uniref:serine/threonine-protein kinase MARK2-like n=1 Tax=Rhinolophus ferrumequinum TaxID=59479 RepID=UPI00140F6849